MSEPSGRPASGPLNTLIERIGVVPLEETLRDLLKRGSATLGVERVSYWSMAPDGTAIRRELQFHRFRDEFENVPLSLEARNFPAYFKALHQGSSLIVANDAMEDARLEEFHETYFRRLGIGAMLDAPVHRDGRLSGVVCHEHVGGPREWSADEIDFARHVARWIARALDIDERQRAGSAPNEGQAHHRPAIEPPPPPTD